MATLKSQSFSYGKQMRVDGSAVHIGDTATAATIGDVLEYPIPAGLEIFEIDARSAAGTMTFSAGVRGVKADTLIATNTTFFAAAGQAFTSGRKQVTVNGVKFDEPAVLTLTTAVAAGAVYVVINGNQVGPR